jgi:hypothetical protein
MLRGPPAYAFALRSVDSARTLRRRSSKKILIAGALNSARYDRVASTLNNTAASIRISAIKFKNFPKIFASLKTGGVSVIHAGNSACRFIRLAVAISALTNSIMHSSGLNTMWEQFDAYQFDRNNNSSKNGG